jgi:hypothetical protein
VNESGSGNFSSGTYKPHPSATQAMTIRSQGGGPHSGGSQFVGSQIRSRSQSLNSQLAATVRSRHCRDWQPHDKHPHNKQS